MSDEIKHIKLQRPAGGTKNFPGDTMEGHFELSKTRVDNFCLKFCVAPFEVAF
jgi:hypothetical protein